MGQLFTRLSSDRSDLQTSSIVIPNNFTTLQSIGGKRKCIDQDIVLKRRKILLNNKDNSTARLIISSRISKSSKFSNTSIITRSLLPMTMFKCQLCCRCFTSKDSYLDHMIICAIEHQASIKIVRAKKTIHFSHEE